MSDSIFDANDEAIEAWNTILFDKFLQFRKVLVDGLGKHGVAALKFYPPKVGMRVLDVGCGFGDSTIDIARLVGTGGEAVGVDAGERFIQVAKMDAEAAGVRNCHFMVGDAQDMDLKGPYDQVFARFGTMFVASPVATFKNIRKNLKANGEFTQVVWRKKEENPFLAEVENRVLEIIPHPEKGDQITCGPGPFALAHPDVVSTQLKVAGFDRIRFERYDTEIYIGRDLDEAVNFAMNLGPAGEIIRLAGEEGERKKPEVIEAIKEVLSKRQKADGVYGLSSSWIVTARNPVNN